METICTKLALAFLSSLEHVAEGLSLKEDQIATLNRVFVQLGDTSPISLDEIERNVDLSMLTKTPHRSPSGSNDPGDLAAAEEKRQLSQEDSLDAGESPGVAGGVEFLSGHEQSVETPTPGPDGKVVFDFTAAHDVLCAKRTEQDEQESAKRFLVKLAALIPRLLGKISTIEVDEDMQQFASDFCEGKTSLVVLFFKSCFKGHRFTWKNIFSFQKNGKKNGKKMEENGRKWEKKWKKNGKKMEKMEKDGKNGRKWKKMGKKNKKNGKKMGKIEENMEKDGKNGRKIWKKWKKKWKKWEKMRELWKIWK